MTILSLDIAQFGMFRNRTVNLRSGVNIITGDNESGKTTLSDFITCMLFGMDSAAEYRKYLPYSYSGVYGGKMKILYDERIYEIERSFLRDDPTLTIRSLDDGCLIDRPEMMLQEIRGTVTREEFSRIGLISKDSLEKGLKECDDYYKTPEEIRDRNQKIQFRKAYRLLETKKENLEIELDTEYEDPENLKKLRNENEEAFYRRNAEIFDLERELKEKKILLREKQQWDASESKKALEREKVGKRLQKAEFEEDELGKAGYAVAIVFLSVGFAALLGAGVYGYLNLASLFTSKVMLILSGLAMLAFGLLIAGMIVMIVTVTKHKKARQKVRSFQGELEALAASAPPSDYSDVTGDIVESISRLIAVKRGDVGMLQQEQGDLDHRIIRAERSAKRKKELGEEVRAVTMAMDSFEELTDVHAEEKMRSIVRQANEYYREMAADGESEIVLTESDEICLSEDGKRTALHDLSGHSAFEALFALKNAMFDAADRDAELPLVLDDALNNLDKDRMMAAMGLIHSLKRQVVLFTCHTRERQVQYGTEE